MQAYAGAIPGQAWIVFIPSARSTIKLKSLDPNRVYRAFFFNPSDRTERAIQAARTDASCAWQVPELPIFRDWILVVEKS